MTFTRRIAGPKLALAGFAGAVSGLALARALAESFPSGPTFHLWPTLLLTSIVTAGVVLVCGWLWSSSALRRPLCLIPLFLPAIYLFWPDAAPQVGWALLIGGTALTVLFIAGQDGVRISSRSSHILSYDRFVAVLLAGITFVLYLRTLGPTVGQADTFEFQVVAPTLGVAHPTGYPLYILSGKLFSLLPFGSVAWRVNLTSAVFATATVVLLYQLVRRLTGRSLVALIAALAFACSRVFWSQAVVAEVYALHNLFVVVVLLVLVELIDLVHTLGKTCYVLALVLGLSFANHLTTALLLPAVGLTLLFLLFCGVWRRSGVNVWAAIGLFLLGLSLYLYIYFRWPMLHDGVWMSPGEFWRYVTGQQFGGALRLDAWRTDPARYQIVGRLLREPFGWAGLVLGAIGLVWLTIKKRRVALITFVTFLAYAWYAVSYYVPDVSVFLLPAHLVLAVWMGTGLAALVGCRAFPVRGESASRCVESVHRGLGESRERPWLSAVVISLGALLPLCLLWTNLKLVDQSGEREAYAWGQRVLDLPLAPDAAILADSARIAPLYYIQRIEGRRPDLDMLVLADEATYRAELDARLAAGQTVYLARFLPGLEGLYHLRSLGPLTEVGTAPLTEPPPLDRVLGLRFGPDIQLLGLTGPIAGPDGGTGLTLYWRSDAPVNEVYHVRLRLVDSDGQVWWQNADAGRHAANNYYPTVAWRPGEVVADYHEIPPLIHDSTVGEGGYTVQVGLFRPFSDAGLAAEVGGVWRSLLALDVSAELVKAMSGPVHSLRAQFDAPVDTLASPTRPSTESGAALEDDRRCGTDSEELVLVGVDLADIVTADSPIELTLYSPAFDVVNLSSPAEQRGAGRPSGCSSDDQARPVLTWTDQAGSSVEATVLERWGRARLLLQAPASPGDYRLRLGWVDQEGQPFTARCGWLARPTDDCVLATLHVASAAASALANFDGKMLLLDVEAGASILRPGQSLSLMLHWQGLQPIKEDYTVSVQIIGPDGRLYGQTDAWPVQGTLPTSQWLPGQRIADPYIVALSADAPADLYQLGVVVYRLATQTRLPLLDESGQATGDIAWVGELLVTTEGQ